MEDQDTIDKHQLSSGPGVFQVLSLLYLFSSTCSHKMVVHGQVGYFNA